MFEILCPHCHCLIMIEEVNCAIFRHGVFKNTFEQIPPHLSKSECEHLIYENSIYGCGKPFRLVKVDDKYIPEICDYI